jgi:hypothetical protein
MIDFAITGRCDAVPPPDWREQLAAMLGAKPRRIGLWAELALFGALRCMADAGETRLPPDAILMLGSRYGTHAATVDALGQMADDLPMPLVFLQTQPSQVLALLAEQLSWQGHGSFLAGGNMVDARLLAELQAGTGGALLGWVEDRGAYTTHWLRLRRMR